jgi:cyclase
MRWFEELKGPIRAGTEEGTTGAGTAVAGFVATSRGALLVDAFTLPADGAALYQAARETAGQVAGLVYTHEHGDHFVGSSGFPRDLLVLASQATATGLRGIVERNAAYIREQGLDLRLPTVEFAGATRPGAAEPGAAEPGARVVLPWEPEVVLVELGGHTRGSTVVHVPSEDTVFTGDLVFATGLPWVGDADLDRWVAAMSQIESWNPARVIPGHGPVSGPEILVGHRDWLERFAGRLGELRADGASAGEVLDRLAAEFDLFAPGAYDERLRAPLLTALGQRFGFPA